MAIQFDPELKARLAAFQLANGLSGDGVAGPATWTKLAAQPATPAESISTEVWVEADPVAATARDGGIADPADFPVLMDLFRYPRTEEGVKQFLLARCGLDLDALFADIDAVLEEAESATTQAEGADAP